MGELQLILSTIGIGLGIIISCVTIMCFQFYTKTQVDEKIKQAQDNTEKKDLERIEKVEIELKSLNEALADCKLKSQEARCMVKDDLQSRLDVTKLALEEAMKHFVTTLTEIKQADKEMAVQFITLVNEVKDELKNDYTARYNDLLLLINTKANESDFNRLENKFDKLSEIMTELKTIVQIQLEGKRQQ